MGPNTAVTAFLAKGEEEVLYEADSLTLISGLVLAFSLTVFHWSISILTAVFFGTATAELLGRKMYRERALLSIGARLHRITFSHLFTPSWS